MPSTQKIIACIDDRPWIPYTDPNNPGTMQIRMNEIAKTMNVEISYEVLPWKRCQKMTRLGKVNAIVGVAFVPFIRELAEFPMKGSQVDTTRSLDKARIMLVRKIGSVADWDGKAFRNVRSPIAVAQGTRVMFDAVVSFGGRAEDDGKTDEQNIRKVIQGRVELMAGFEYDLLRLTKEKFQGQVEILPIPLLETHYYLGFSKQFYGKRKELALEFWDRIGKSNQRRL